LRPSRLLILASCGLLVAIWGTTWAAIRVGLAGIPPMTGVALRFGIAAAVLLVLAKSLGVRLGQQPRERWLWLANAVCTFSVPYAIVYWAELWVPSGLAAVLFATFPLWVALLAHFTLPAERLNSLAALGILLGFGGVAVIFSEDFAVLGGRWVAKVAAVYLIAPFFAAFGQVAVKRWGGGIHPLSVTAMPMAITAVVMGALAAVCERGRPLVLDRSSVLALLYLALCGSAVTFSVYFWLLSKVSATSLSLINYVLPVVAVTVGTLWMREPLTLRIVVGSLLVIAGVGLAMQAAGRQARRGDSGSESAPLVG